MRRLPSGDRAMPCTPQLSGSSLTRLGEPPLSSMTFSYARTRPVRATNSPLLESNTTS